jgi:hypothetical protein
VVWIFTAISSWVMRDYAEEFNVLNTTCRGFSPSVCSGKESVLRISFGNVLFFSSLSLLTLGVSRDDNPRLLVHNAGWIPKALCWVGALVGCFFIPSSVVQTYGQVARALSSIYLVIQVRYIQHRSYKKYRIKLTHLSLDYFFFFLANDPFLSFRFLFPPFTHLQIIQLLDLVYKINGWLVNHDEAPGRNALLWLLALITHGAGIAAVAVSYWKVREGERMKGRKGLQTHELYSLSFSFSLISIYPYDS